MPQPSILYLQPTVTCDATASRPAEPACFADLNLDQLARAVIAGREEYDLLPFFYHRAGSAAEVAYRQAVFADLELECNSELRASLDSFAGQMHAMRGWLSKARQVRDVLQQAQLFLEAAAAYCDAVAALAAGLSAARLRSAGLLGFARFLRSHLETSAHAALRDDVARITRSLASITYTLHVKGNRITVGAYDGETDYGEDVTATFARFAADDWHTPEQARPRFPELLQADELEAGILERVALQFPAVFDELTTFFEQRHDYLSPVITRFDREVQFYLAYLDHLAPVRAAGLAFCYPQVSESADATTATGTFDLALAGRLVPEQERVTCNDIRLEPGERLLVVTGPNQGGKTTYARTFGQLHYLASLGVPVAGTSAAVALADEVFTHFEREEEVATLAGKLLDDLVRLHEILQQATSRSVIILNEVFTSATLSDAVALGTRVIEQVTALGSRCVCVTFLDELAAGPHAVSMVAEVSPRNPAERTFRLTRRPADGLAYADAVAARHGLSYDQVRARVAR